MPDPCKRKRKRKEKRLYTRYIWACMPAPPPHMPTPPPHLLTVLEGHLGPPIWYGPPCALALLPPGLYATHFCYLRGRMPTGATTSGAVSPPILLPLGPQAPQSCYLRGRKPPSPATYLATVLPTPVQCPYGPPISYSGPPCPSPVPRLPSYVWCHSLAHPVTWGTRPPPIQYCRVSAPIHSVL